MDFNIVLICPSLRPVRLVRLFLDGQVLQASTGDEKTCTELAIQRAMEAGTIRFGDA